MTDPLACIKWVPQSGLLSVKDYLQENIMKESIPTEDSENQKNLKIIPFSRDSLKNILALMK